MNHDETFYISALPSFTEGMARVLDLGTTLDVFNESATPEAADLVAVGTDWLAVGHDLRGAMQQYEKRPQFRKP